MKKRSITLDVLKGLAILLVVLGHSIDNGLSHAVAATNMLHVAIYAFHMPLFFLITGYVLYFTLPTAQMYKKWLTDKAMYLLIPHFLIMALVLVLPRWMTNQGITLEGNTVWKNVSDAIFFSGTEWFLWTMLIVLALLSCVALIDKAGKAHNFWICFGITTAAIVILPTEGPDIFRIWEVQWYYQFAALGYVIAKVQDKLTWRWAGLIIGAACFVPLLFASGWLHIPLQSLIHYILIGEIDMYVVRVLQALAGSSMVIIVAILLGKIKGLSWPFQWVGRYSLSIYAIHYLFTGLGFGTGYIRVMWAFALSLAISIVVILICRQIPRLQRWFPKASKFTHKTGI